MRIDTRTGAAPPPGIYRMETYDGLFGPSLEYVEVTGYSKWSPATGLDYTTFWFKTLSTGSFNRGRLASANLVGERWYRVFTPVPPMTSPGGTGLL